MLIIIVLLQQGKGADAGATFGGGGNTVFGSAGADNLLTKVTTFIAIAFMCTSVYLAVDAKDARANKGSLMESLPSALPIQDNLPVAGTKSDMETNQEVDVKEEAAPADAATAEEPAAAATSEEAAALKPESEAFSKEAKATAPEAAPAAEENVAEQLKTEDSPSQ